MSLDFNGSTGYLKLSTNVISTRPFSMVVWHKQQTSGGSQFAFSLSKASTQQYSAIWMDGNGTTHYGTHQVVGSGDSLSRSPTTGSWTPNLYTHSATQRQYWAGNSAVTTNAAQLSNDMADYNRVMVGACEQNGTTGFYFNGDIAEVALYDRELTQTDWDILKAGGKPEDTANCVAHWSLETYQASGNYLSSNGTYTLVASGGVTQGATHPFVRAANVTISATTGNAAAAGATASVAIGQATISCAVGNASAAGSSASIIVPQTISCTAGNAAANGSTASVSNKIMSDNIINNSGTRRPAESANWYWYAGGLSASAATSSGTTVTDSNARLSPGITYAAGDLIMKIGTDVYFESFA